MLHTSWLHWFSTIVTAQSIIGSGKSRERAGNNFNLQLPLLPVYTLREGWGRWDIKLKLFRARYLDNRYEIIKLGNFGYLNRKNKKFNEF